MRFLPSDNILRNLRFCKFWTLVIIFVERLNFSQDDKLLRAESICKLNLRTFSTHYIVQTFSIGG